MTLVSRTPPAWAEAVAADPLALLSDHAHCELKAAATAASLVHRHPRLAEPLAGLLREEADHLQRVLSALRERGGRLAPDRPNPYVQGLRKLCSDELLVAAVIEARSHERFGALAACPALADLHPLYRRLQEAEARHGRMFEELAGGAGEKLEELAAAEAQLIAELPFAYRIHSGSGSTPSPSATRLM